MSTLQIPSQYVLKRLPQDDDELYWAIRALWGYSIPRTAVCKGHTSPFQALADAYFARHPISIWKASRGLGGKSRTLAVLGLTEAALHGCEVSILGGSGAQSLNVHAATSSAWHWHAAPKALLSSPPTKFDTVMSNGGHLRTLMASQNSVRGPHPPRLRMDEIDEMDLPILEAALGQPMRQPNYMGDIVETQTVMSSTHQYPDKTMSAMLKRAKQSGWPVYHWCFRETSNATDGWLTADEIARQKSVIPEHMWRTEFELQEPAFEGRAIDTDAVDRAFDPSYGTFTGDKPVLSDPMEGSHYITAADWAKERDMSIVGTFDISQTPWVCVAWQKMNRLPWPIMVGKAIAQWQTFGGKFVHDATGVGSAVADIIKDQAAPHLHRDIIDFVMTAGRQRQALFTEYVSAIEQGDIKYPRIEYAYDEHRYVVVDDLYGRGHPPDSIIVGALAWSARRKRSILAIPTGGTRGASPWNI